jgi:ABC-2 type transport system ATP-binding protein
MSLQLRSLSRRFGAHAALDAVSVHVRRGDCYGFIGHNGAGKTTAMRIALGLSRADSGSVWVDGFDAARHPREARARMGGLIETPGFHPGFEAELNLRWLARLGGMNGAGARDEARRLLGVVGLSEVGRKPVHAFSQGMRQRLGIAQALLGRPAYVLLDEPTNGLDPQGMAEMRAMLRRLVRDEGITVLVSSHQLHDLADICNRVGVMHQGKLVLEAEMSALLAAAPGRFVLETGDDARARRVVRELGVQSEVLPAGGLGLELGARTPGDVARAVVAAGLDLRRFGATPASLEEVYLRCARGELVVPPAERADVSEESAAHVERRAPPRPIGRVLRYELSRATASWSTPALLALPALLAGASIALQKSRALEEARLVAEGSLATATAVNAFGATTQALSVAIPLLAMVLAGLASQSLAGELARGTLRNVLLRPQTRLEVALGKALAVAICSCAAYSLAVGVALAGAAWAFGFTDVVEILPNDELFVLLEAEELRADLVHALTAPGVALMGCAALGLAAGAVTRGAAAALGLAIGSLFALDLSRALARGGHGEGALLSAYLPTPLGDSSFLNYVSERATGISNSVFEFGGTLLGIPQDLAVPCLWTIASIAAAAILLVRRSVP